jgi:hypothetical protein
MTKIATGSGSASGSISQRHGSSDPDPDPHQNVMDPEHCSFEETTQKKDIREVQDRSCLFSVAAIVYGDTTVLDIILRRVTHSRDCRD